MIYLDYAAATPVDGAVIKAMLPFFSENFANPSSICSSGQIAKTALQKARRRIAKDLNCSEKELIFTSGGTEANNLAIFGLAKSKENSKKHIVSTKIEHSSVMEALKVLEQDGFEVTYLEVDKHGIVSEENLKKALKEDTFLVTVIWANNEVGTIQNIRNLAKITKENGAFFHTDACQAMGAEDIDIKDLGLDLMSINSSKIYGPKGVGLLYKSQKIPLMPQIYGGKQEFGLRAGTENVPLIVGFAEAIGRSVATRREETKRQREMRDYFIEKILREIPESKLNGHPRLRLANNINISFAGVDGDTLLMRLDMAGICASSGAACASGSIEPSHVILALGHTYEHAHSSIRFSLGRQTTKKDLEKTAGILIETVIELRKMSPLF